MPHVVGELYPLFNTQINKTAHYYPVLLRSIWYDMIQWSKFVYNKLQFVNETFLSYKLMISKHIGVSNVLVQYKVQIMSLVHVIKCKVSVYYRCHDLLNKEIYCYYLSSPNLTWQVTCCYFLSLHWVDCFV